MAQNVYMASVAFFVPVRKVMAKSELTLASPETIDFASFVLYPNASCKAFRLRKKKEENTSTLSKTLQYQSRFDGKQKIMRKVNVVPYIIKFSLGKNECPMTLLTLMFSLDKTCDNAEISDSPQFYYTELDIIYLKKAVFENSLISDCPKECFNDWVRELLRKLECRKRTTVKIEYSVTDICVWDRSCNNECAPGKMYDTYEKATVAFMQNYYAHHLAGIDDFLESRIATLNKTYHQIDVPEKNFVYGLLFANDNFMMAHHNAVEEVVGYSYTNNEVEKYWAGGNSILHIKTHSPYYLVDTQKEQRLHADIRGVDGTVEMCMLLFLKRKLKLFEAKYQHMRSEEMSKAQSEIAKCFYTKVFNQEDLDKKLNYFINQFRLKETFDSILSVTLPMSRGREIIKTYKISIVAILIAVLSVIATIIVGLH